MNILANDAPAEQAHAVAPPTKTDALDISLTNDNNPFVAPPSSDTVIEYVTTLGYLNKTAGYDKLGHPVLQFLWGIIHSSNIDYAERIWEE
nr:hypothetical protein [Tanacetum cinerariifolium]